MYSVGNFKKLKNNFSTNIQKLKTKNLKVVVASPLKQRFISLVIFQKLYKRLDISEGVRG